MMKNVLVLFGILALGAMSSAACTGMCAGKGTTADGSVLLGRTVDFSPYNATMRQQVCAPGTQVAFNGATNRYRYVCTTKSTSISKGRYAGSAATDEPTAPFVPTRKSVSE